jgi:hypothetical protein
MSLRLFAPALAAVALLPALVLAADHPDMSGTWAVDAARSDFGPMPVPTDMVFTVKVEGREFFVHQTGGGQPDSDLHFSTSGKEVTNVLPGARMTSTHRWERDAVVGEIKLTADDGTNLVFKDRMSYSPDGKVMTVSRAVTGPTGESQMKIVANKK